MKYGKWKNHRHARITHNLRLMYAYTAEEKTLLFKDIITKNELEKY